MKYQFGDSHKTDALSFPRNNLSESWSLVQTFRNIQKGNIDNFVRQLILKPAQRSEKKPFVSISRQIGTKECSVDSPYKICEKNA